MSGCEWLLIAANRPGCGPRASRFRQPLWCCGSTVSTCISTTVRSVGAVGGRRSLGGSGNRRPGVPRSCRARSSPFEGPHVAGPSACGHADLLYPATLMVWMHCLMGSAAANSSTRASATRPRACVHRSAEWIRMVVMTANWRWRRAECRSALEHLKPWAPSGPRGRSRAIAGDDHERRTGAGFGALPA